jgi:hypothetical protein
VFIDETWAATNMAGRCGRVVRGLRLLAAVPHGHWKVTTLIAGLRTAGITVPRGFDGAINGERFRNYVEPMLAPTLSRGDVLTLDNLSSHKAAGIETVIQARGAKLLYLPPYSPDRNPISSPSPSPPARARCMAAAARRHWPWNRVVGVNPRSAVTKRPNHSWRSQHP